MYSPNWLSRFDLATREFTDTVRGPTVGLTGECCLVTEEAVWLVSHTGEIQRLDLDLLEVTDTIPIAEGTSLNGNDRGVRRGIAAGAIWLPAHGDVVYRIDAETRQLTHEFEVGGRPSQPVFADGTIWVANRDDGTVSRIDPVSLIVTHTIPVGVEPGRPVATDGALWVPNLADRTLSRIQTRP